MAWDTLTLPKQQGGLGIRRACETNIVMLGKQVWHMMHSDMKLWVNMMRGKYVREKDFFQVAPTVCSPAWRAICKARDVLCDGLTCLIHTVNGFDAPLLQVIDASVGVGAAREPRWVRWKFPEPGWICVNVDGSSKGIPGPAGFGGVV